MKAVKKKEWRERQRERDVLDESESRSVNPF